MGEPNAEDRPFEEGTVLAHRLYSPTTNSKVRSTPARSIPVASESYGFPPIRKVSLVVVPLVVHRSQLTINLR